MTTNDTKPETCIEDLPNELLSRIFACIPTNDNDLLDEVQLVSKRWYAVVDETIGREMRIHSLTTDDKYLTAFEFPHLPHADWGQLGFDMISKMGVKTCHVALSTQDLLQSLDKPRVNANGDSNEASSSPIPSFKYPHLLKNLHITGAIRSDLFHSLIKDTENLGYLQIPMLAISQLVPTDLKNIKLPQLHGLHIDHTVKHEYGSKASFDVNLGLRNLQILFEESTFPNLNWLQIPLSIRNFRDFGTFKSALKFLSIHTNLKTLYVFMDSPDEMEVTQGFEEELEDLIDFAKKTKNRDSLRKFEIHVFFLDDNKASYPHLKVWLAFLEQQKSLRTLTLGQGYVPDKSLGEICANNKNSLTTLSLTEFHERTNNDPRNLDCQVFASASRLQTLIVSGSDLTTNTKALPKSISTLSLSGAISTPEVELILFDLPVLQRVNLKDACLGMPGFGVKLELLRRIIEVRKVKRVIMNGGSLSDDYPDRGLSNGDSKNPERLVVKNKVFGPFGELFTEFMFLDWELNEDNYYINNPDSNFYHPYLIET